MIKVENLDISFGAGSKRVHAVRGVDFAVARGESFGLVGESGSGKSTVLRAIAGLVAHWRGVIAIDGASVERKRTRGLRKRLQMVFQDPYGSLHPRHTVNDILKEPLIIHRMDNREARVLKALDEVGLGAGYRFRYPHQLSGGQRQRIAIARPTSSLDVSVQAEVLNLLARLRRERQLTYIMVSHDLAIVAHLCGRIAVMNRGVFVEEMSSEQLRAGTAEHGYTRQLLVAAKGYDRAAIDQFVEFD